MAREFKAGDVLIFQLESAFGLLKVLAVDDEQGEIVWHLAAFEDMFLDSETADAALLAPENMRFSAKHLAVTNRAFESTQTARMTNVGVSADEVQTVNEWRENPNREVSDCSVRLLLGLR